MSTKHDGNALQGRDLSPPITIDRRRLLIAAATGVAAARFAGSPVCAAVREPHFNDHTQRVLRGETKMKTRNLGTLEVSSSALAA